MTHLCLAKGMDVSADQYVYTAGGNGLASNLPGWAQEGGLEETLKRLKDPALRERMKREIREPQSGVDNPYFNAGGGKGLLLIPSDPTLKQYVGKRLSEAARMMGKGDELDAMFDLLIRDRLQTVELVFMMDESDVRAAMREPWIGVCCDASTSALDGVLSKDSTHPRAFGCFPRLLGKYVRDEHVLTLENAIHKMTQRSAERVHLTDRGVVRTGYYADLAVFDPDTVTDHATYERPLQLSTGMRYVLVNGKLVLDGGKQTPARPGRVLRRRGSHMPVK